MSKTFRKWMALTLAIIAVSLPINNVSDYALILACTVVIFSGDVTPRGAFWAAAIGVVFVKLISCAWLSPSKIEEGHNISCHMLAF